MSGLLNILAASEPSPAAASSNYMPSVRVEIAFNAGYLTPASLRTWTDVSDYLELADGITITGGRGDERSTADANHLTLTFDNSDGRFTFGKTTGPYGSSVKLGRPIRVIADPVDGTESVRFLGFIDELPTDWSDGTDASAYTTVAATSRLARLGTQAALKSVIETVILADGPMAYYMLSEPAGATQANDSSGSRASAAGVVTVGGSPVIFGDATGPATDGLTAATFPGPGAILQGDYLRAPGAETTYAGVSIEAFFLAAAIPSSGDAILGEVEVTGSSLSLGIGQVNGKVTAGVLGIGVSIFTAGSMCDGATHHACATWDGVTLILYVDGVSVGTTAVAGTPKLGTFSFGGNFSGVAAHVAIYGVALSAAQVASHASAGLTGYAGETTSARLIRYAGYAGMESAAVSAETGSTTVQHIDTTEKHAVDLMRVMETTEGGVLYDERDGTTTFHNRAHRLTAASAFTLSMTSQTVESGYVPKADRTAVANTVDAKDVSGQFTADVFDATSRNDNGVATISIETASQDDDEPLFQAGWALYKFKDVRERVPALTINALAQVGKTPNCATVMAATVGTKITVSNRLSQAASSSVDYFIEGWTEVYGQESLFITWNLSPSSPEDQTLVIGDATRGVIGTNPVAL